MQELSGTGFLAEDWTVEQKQLTVFLQDLLKSHGVETAPYDEWLLSGGHLPALRGTWHPGAPGLAGRLDIHVALEDGRWIEECFAGFGDAEEACKNALLNFSLSSLHVLLAALWGRVDEEQVEIEDWHFLSQHWRVWLGNFVPRVSAGTSFELPPDAFKAIEQAVKAETLGPSLHWVRTFYCNIGNGETMVEALLDNEPWEAGMQALSGLGWIRSESYYSARHFFVLDANPSSVNA